MPDNASTKPPLGKFSVSLAVKDIAVSKDFYTKLGFEPFDGNQDEGWLMLRHGNIKIGLFQGMFDANILTFHPEDARAIQKSLKSQDVTLMSEAKDGEGPAHLMLTDPDGNQILIDQH